MVDVKTGFWARLREIDLFFDKRDQVHKTMRRVVKRLASANIDYAVMGGMAVFFLGHHRTTNDVDVLLTEEGFAEFRRRFVPRHYENWQGRVRRFKDKTSNVNVDIRITGRCPGSGRPGPIAFPFPKDVAVDVEDIRFINLRTLIQLKLAARRHQDFADVVSLIRVHNLDETYQEKLHPTVHRDYIECLEEKRREDEYEAREA